MLLVDGLWAVEFCADRWVKIPKRMISTEIPRQRQYDDTLPTMSVFFKLLRKRWADVCLEVVEFCAKRLLPVGSTQFCKSIQLAEPVSSFDPSRPTVFALRFSQFCSVFIDLSLFSWLPSTDISEFLSSIALDRTILRSVQRSQDSFAVAPSVQLSLEQHQSSSSSDSSSSLHFDQTDINATASSRPTISPDLSAVVCVTPCEIRPIFSEIYPRMVSMFEALMASGLRGFLGCPAIVYEDALVDFFENASVCSGVVISTVGGQLVEISEKLFAETFELPIDGLGDLSEMPKDAIFDARSIVSLSGEPISLSGRKNQMKMTFRLLCDIVAKAISVKAGSFNAITVEKFSLITAVVCKIKMNWAKFLFGVLKKMVSARSKQAKGFAIQISVLLATFPSVELGESSEFPASKVLSKKTVLRFVSINDRDGAEEVTGAAKTKAVSKKRPAVDIEAAVPKKKRNSKKKSISSISSLEMVAVAEEAVPIQQVAEPLDVEEPRCSSADAVDLIIQQVLDETRATDAPANTAEPAVSEEKNWFDLPYDDLVKQWEAERPVVTASDTEDEIATEDVAPADEVQQVEAVEAPISAVETLSADEKMSLDDILLTIPVDIPLPSTCMEVSKIIMGKYIKIPGVSKWSWFLKSLPCIPAGDKGKEILVEKDPVKGNPAAEHYSLICADIDLLVSLRAKVIDEVATFFNSFSLKKLASINIEDMYRKEEQVLTWGETESPQEAIQRKFYILLKYRTILVWKFLEAWRVNFAPGQGSSAVDIQVIELLSDLYLYFLEELAKEARNLGLTWTKPCCSTIFEGSPRDRGTIISRSNSNTRSLCWIRRMLFVDGLWAVEFCADRWVKIPKRMISTEVPRQRQYDDTLPTMSVFFKLLRKRWADVCLEVVEFCAKRLLPVGSTQFCKSIQLAEPVSSFDPSSAQENHNVIHAQLSELVDYIHRGSAEKKGESGSRGLQKPANTQKEGSAVTPTFEQRVQMAQRRIVQTVLDADANRESQDAAERDRERIRKEARSLKRRIKD
ncbi:hypothetical protein F511_25224 [Dorcoceras hygrometricum]|uniref:Dystroglycan-like n=1 Tax=Dorcoceras hygrometricum TaxID=472368 RepID=A0A2Z7BD00_9LAMI|nr:hypothetical protein F511_25224 [Dorcoceras hygrometricum]